jgi:pyruvate formate lyase activating enzyme
MIPPIKGFIENSLIEWEGQIAAVLFLPGCNFRCRYCHASHLVLEPQGLESIPFDAILNCVGRQREWVDGVVISGGEPTLHDPELRHLIRSLKGIPTKVWLETNGTRPSVLQKLIAADMLDGVAMDIKAPFSEYAWRRITRSDVDVRLVRQSAELIRSKVSDHEFKVTVVPGHIGPDDVAEIARSVEGAARLALQNLRPLRCMDESLHDVTPFSPEALEEMADRARPYVRDVVIRGATRVSAPRRVA